MSKPNKRETFYNCFIIDHLWTKAKLIKFLGDRGTTASIKCILVRFFKPRGYWTVCFIKVFFLVKFHIYLGLVLDYLPNPPSEAYFFILIFFLFQLKIGNYLCDTSRREVTATMGANIEELKAMMAKKDARIRELEVIPPNN